MAPSGRSLRRAKRKGIVPAAPKPVKRKPKPVKPVPIEPVELEEEEEVEIEYCGCDAECKPSCLCEPGCDGKCCDEKPAPKPRAKKNGKGKGAKNTKK